MTHEEETNLHNMEALVRQLMMAYRQLRGEKSKLAKELADCRLQLEQEQRTTEELRRDYEVLRTARMLEVSGDDIKLSRQRLAKLIREVDKCIAMLDV